MAEFNEVFYTLKHWNLLKSLRDEAMEMMAPLYNRHIQAFVYGSIARGDIKPTSDIDIFVPYPPALAIVETLIEDYKSITHREIIQATPNYAAKAYIHTDENRSYSFPLVPLRSYERDFYNFAGNVNYIQLKEETRVPGVTKDLKLITPNSKGHIETPVRGFEGEVAKTLSIGVTAVLDRLRTLQRREKIGRTGVYIKRMLHPHETFGNVYNNLARKRPPIRRRQRE